MNIFSPSRDIMYVNRPNLIHTRRVSLDDIIYIVCEEFQISRECFLGPIRQRRFSQARKAFWFIARDITGYSLPQLGRYVGGRDHTTVLSGLKSMDHDLHRYPLFKEKYMHALARVRML